MYYIIFFSWQICGTARSRKTRETKAENIEFKARIVKLEDKQSQNELVKNLLSVSQKT